MKTEQVPLPRRMDEWRCFHCGETFFDREAAAAHFGPTQHHDPACQYSADRIRALELEIDAYRQEDTLLHRYMYGLQSRHYTELRRQEEDGYAKGLAAPLELLTEPEVRAIMARSVGMSPRDLPDMIQRAFAAKNYRSVV